MKITIPGQVPPKKNSKRVFRTKTGRTIVLPSKAFAKWHDASVKIIPKSLEPYNLAVVNIKFWVADKRRRDLTNMAESVMDLLVDVCILKDDCWQVVPELTLKVAGIDKENPRAEVWII